MLASPSAVIVATSVGGSGGGGSGTVRSVSFTGDGVLFQASAGTPVTVSGTLTPVTLTHAANLILAGPATGSAATPTFRALVAADIPNLPASIITSGLLPVARGGTGTASPALVAGTNITITGSWPNQTINSTASGSGTVTSVSFTGDGVLFTATPDTPVTTAGTLTPSLISQTANTILAGPTTGSAAAPTFRGLVLADLPSIAASNLSNGVTGSGAIVLAASPTITGTLTTTTLVASTLNLSGATPSVAAGHLGLGTTTGVGNSTNELMTTPAQGSGSGPATPTLVVTWLEVNLGGSVYWTPLFQ